MIILFSLFCIPAYLHSAIVSFFENPNPYFLEGLGFEVNYELFISTYIMAIPVVEFSNQGYKIRKIFAQRKIIEF